MIQELNEYFQTDNEGGESGYQLKIDNGKICLWKLYTPDGEAYVTISEDSLETWEARLSEMIVYEGMAAHYLYEQLVHTLQGVTYDVSLWG